jgi:hypothetical protein
VLKVVSIAAPPDEVIGPLPGLGTASSADRPGLARGRITVDEIVSYM